MEVSINGQSLTPGKDFIVSPESRGVKGKGKLVQQDSTHFVDPNNRIVVSLENKLTWSVAPEEADYTTVVINRKALSETPSTMQVNIENKFVENFKTANVAGIVKGTFKPDSLIVFTAHYDHLGGM